MHRWLIWLPISAVLLGLLVARTRPWEATALASTLPLGQLAAAALVNLVVIAGWTIRSSSLMAAVGSPVGLAHLVRVVTLANTVNNLTPASSGELLRAVILERRFGVPYASSTAVIVAERFWAIGIMLVTALAASVGTLVPAPALAALAAWVGAAAASFVPSLLYRAGLRPGRLAARHAPPSDTPPRRTHRLAAMLAAADDQLAVVLTSPRRAIHFASSTALIFVAFAVQLWLILDALGADVSPVGAWAALGLAVLAGVISALPFGLGAADIVLVALLGVQGVGPATAAAAALLLRFLATLPLGIVGTLAWVSLAQRRHDSSARPEQGTS